MKTLQSRDNPLLKRVRGLAQSARDRRKHGETLLDGAHLLSDALRRQWPLKAVLFSASGLRHSEIDNLHALASERASCFVVPDATFAALSPVDTPSGVLALIDLPAPPPAPALRDSILVLDGVQDPGNLGAILRTAAAAKLSEVFLTAGCAQAWSPRALRAGMGAHFVLAVHEHVDALAVLADFPGAVLATALGEGTQDVYEVDLARPIAWLFGAEGQGVSAALRARADQFVHIPMAAAIESLNVGAAVAICLFEQVRQQRVRGHTAA